MPTNDYDLYAALVDAAAEQSDLAALQKYTPLLEALAAAYGHRLYQGIAQRAWGVIYRLIGDSKEAESRFTSATIIFDSLDTRWQLGRTYMKLGELAQARSGWQTATQYYTDALTAFESLGARVDAQRARAALLRSAGSRW